MKILISPVGARDPTPSNSDEEGAALTLCRYLEPEVVYLLPTAERPDVQGSTAPNAEATKERLRTILPNPRVYTKPLDVSDPTDFYQVLVKLKTVISTILEETKGFAEREFFLNASSATPQIQASCLLSVSSGLLPAKAYQVADPRYRVGQDRVREIPATLFQEEQVLDVAFELYKRHMFDACSQQLGTLHRLTQSLKRRGVIEIWHLLCSTYGAADGLKYGLACTNLREAVEKIGRIPGYHEMESLVGEQLKALNALRIESQQAESQLLLSDLYHNAARRLNQGNYVDTLSRVWRLLEGGMFDYLRKHYHVEPSDLAKSPSQENAARLAKNGEMPPSLSFATSLAALAEVYGDKPFIFFLDQDVPAEKAGKTVRMRDALKDLSGRRNKSMVAHGVQPVEERTARTALILAKDFLLFLFPECELDDHPLAQQKLQRVGAFLKELILRDM